MYQKRPILVTLSIIVMLVLSSCKLDTTGALTNAGQTAGNNIPTQDYEQLVASQESADWEKMQRQITVEPLTETEKENIGKALNGDTNYSINQGQIDWDGAEFNINTGLITIGQGETAFAIQTLQLAPQTFKSLYEPFIKNAEATTLYAWENLFHWTNHMPNRYALSANGAWFNTIIRGALQGDGLIWEFSTYGSGNAIRHQFMFVTKVSANGGPAMPWAVILTDTGAIITGYNTGNYRGVYKEQEAARFLQKMLQRGYTPISPEQLPSAITKVWGGNSNPPIIRYWLWSLGYQIEVYARMYALTFAEAASALTTWAGTSLVTPVFFWMPDDCEINYTPGLCGQKN